MAATATAQAWNDQWWSKRKKPLPISKATNQPIKKHLPVTQKIRMLQQIEAARARGEKLISVCNQLGISRKSYANWRRTFELTQSFSDGILYYRKISPKERA